MRVIFEYLSLSTVYFSSFYRIQLKMVITSSKDKFSTLNIFKGNTFVYVLMARNDCFSLLRQDLEPECKSLTAACKEHLVLWVKRFQELRKSHVATLKASHLSIVESAL